MAEVIILLMIFRFKKLFLILLPLALLFFTLTAFALSPGLTPFGGKITRYYYCGCSQNFLIEYKRVRSFMPEYLTLGPESKVYPYATFQIGSEILGTTIRPDACVYGHHCHSIATELIGIVGTSR